MSIDCPLVDCNFYTYNSSCVQGSMGADIVRTDISWIDVRERVVEQAIADGDYEALRKISALPGGFGGEDMRRRVWCVHSGLGSS